MTETTTPATRRDARERALQVLFGLDLNPAAELESALAESPEGKAFPPRIRQFFEELVRGVVEHRAAIDALITRQAPNWTVDRMGVVDRNVLRIGVYELLHARDVPPAVAINEAVDIAKYFSSRESGRFINGILDEIRKAESGSA